ncbi:MAG TPA: MlaD family protein [Phycisphaerae bacterium]|nr:MlaD family protein [Phycisphaerae bacterium]
MSETRNSFWVGLFVLCGLAALGTLIILFGQAPTWLMGGDTYTVDIYFDYASGIRPGTQVTVNGKPIGRVQDVQFKDPKQLRLGVKVIVAIENQYRLRKGSRAVTYEAGLLAGGRPPIQIEIPSQPEEGFLEPGQFVMGEIRSAFDAVFPTAVIRTFEKSATQIGEAADALKPVLVDLHEVMQPRSIDLVDRPGGPPGNLSTAMARIDGTLRNVNEIIGDPEVRRQVKDSVANIHAMTEDGKVVAADLKQAATEAREVITDIRTLVGDAQGSLKKADGHFDRLARKGMDFLESASRVVDELHTTTRQLNQGEGTVGKLLVDAKLYDAMVLTFRRLAETTEEFRLLVKDWQKGGLKTRF